MMMSQKLEQLLQPVEGNNPAGVYLKEDRTRYRPLRNAFNVAQTSFRKLTNNPPDEELDDLQQTNNRNWEELSHLLLDVISDHSKDLECISWLALAQLFSAHPYENLAGCLQLIGDVIERFDEQTHPRLPDNKLRATDEAGRKSERAGLQLKPLVQVFGESEETSLLGLPLRMLPLLGDIDYVTWRNADRQGNRSELQQAARQALTDNQNEVIQRIHGMDAGLKALDHLDAVLADYARGQGITPISSRFLRMQLTANLNAVKSLTEGVLVPWPLDVQVQAQPEEQPATGTVADKPIEKEVSQTAVESGQGAASEAGEHIYNRDQAFQQLRLIADYFSRTEPQSPVAGLIEKAIRWGYTPLPDLISELVQGHDGMMGRIGELTGMNTDKVVIPGVPAHRLVAPPTDSPLAPSQRVPDQQLPSTEIQTVKADEGDVPAKKTAREKPESATASADAATKKEERGVPSFLNLSATERKTSTAKTAASKQPRGPGGVDLSQLRRR